MAENKKGFITLTVVFEAMSLNRDEGMGNIQTLHLLTRGNGEVFSYMSRQALTYAVRKFLIESEDSDNKWFEALVVKAGSGNKKTDQYLPALEFFPEIDLFGYMSTFKGEGALTRPAPVTFTHAISMEPYNGDLAFYANPEMARRANDDPNPYTRQEHISLYKYSVLIDLSRIGIEENGEENNGYVKLEFKMSPSDWDRLINKYSSQKENTKQKKIEIEFTKEKILVIEKVKERENKKEKEITCSIIVKKEVEKEEKIKRIEMLLNGILHLSHQISGSREPLYPLFIAAAHLKYGSPIFHNYVELKYNKEKKAVINGELFENGLEHAKKIAKNGNERIIWGMLKGAGALHLDIEGVETNSAGKPIDVIEKVKNWVCEIYEVNSSVCKDE